MSAKRLHDHDEAVETDVPLRPVKQPRTLHETTRYSIAWICALHIEMAAARAMLDEVYDDQPRHLNDSNAYILGRIHRHSVVVACLPTAQYGITNAANVLTHLIRTFPSIRLGLMVGIGGGVPSRAADIRLGDVVVGTRVMPYDLGKVVENGEIQYTGIQKVPHQLLGTVVSSLRSKHELYGSLVSSILDDKMASHAEYQHPNLPDRLFHAIYDHDAVTLDCADCDQSQLISRRTRTNNNPVIHYGAIASGNKVMKHGLTRDDYARKLHDVICFEMEAAGLMDVLPCLPIRGICDYSDSHKNKEWQRYAAATAAAYARELLGMLPANEAEEALPSETSHSDKDGLQERRTRLLSSLEFEQIDSRKTSIKRAHARTCQWLLKLQEYQQWLDFDQASSHHGFLWIRGKPGVGKSTIMKFIYQRMKNGDQKGHVLTASFFFNARGEYLEKSIIGMYRSLLLQLLQGFPELQSVFEDYEIIPRSQADCPPLDVLKNLFQSAVLRLGKRSFTCYVDALDECDEQQTVEMVEYFEDLAESAMEHDVRLRICFSSRHYPFIDIRMGLRLTLEDQQGHVDDLNKYINANLRIKDSALLTELQERLLEKSAGVFLWVVLVVDILNRENRRGRLGLRKRLAEVPSGLTELFKDMLKRDHENMEDLRLCIIWILFAKRPLRPAEYYSAIWAGLSLEGLADEEPPDVMASDAEDSFERCVISSSKGLAEITKGKRPIVQFIHESVRDFLIKDNGLYELWPQLGFDWEGRSHEILKQCCIFYLKQEDLVIEVKDFGPTIPPWTSATNIVLKYSLLEYAGHHLLYHADAASEMVAQDDFLSQFDYEKWRSVYNIAEEFTTRKYAGSANLIYVLADQGLARLTRLWLKTHPSINDRCRYEEYQLPFFAAMANGNKETIAALLGAPSTVFNGCDIMEGIPNRTAFKAMGFKGRSALTWASEHGRGGFVSWLLQNGTMVDEEDFGGYTALKRASEQGHVNVVKILLDHGADVNLRPPRGAPGRGRSALFKAVEEGHIDVVKFLLLHCADPNGLDFPLSRALGGPTGHPITLDDVNIEMVILLLDAGANISLISSMEREIALLCAARYGHEDHVRLLVGHGVHVHAVGGLYGDLKLPLHEAAAKGAWTLATYLVDKGAHIEAETSCGETALTLAVADGNISFAKALIERGANVNAFWYAFPFPGTLLEVACNFDHIEIAKLLLQNGANVRVESMLNSSVLRRAADRDVQCVRLIANVSKSLEKEYVPVDFMKREIHSLEKLDTISGPALYTTPLHTACTRGNGDLAILLLSHGAPVDPPTEDGSSPLHVACILGYKEVVRLLIDHGADPDKVTNAGQSALQLASIHRHHDVVELLVERCYGGNYPDSFGVREEQSSDG